MVMAPTCDARSPLGLFLVQHRQQTKDERDAGVKLYAHKAVRDGFGNVFEMHGLAFYEHANGDDGVEWGRGCNLASSGA
jgi:hypothetical protein